MNRLDLIIDALENAVHNIAGDDTEEKCIEALAAARELRELKPVGYMDSKGILFNDTTHPHLNTPLYALDEVTK
jgi:hypothetical protein